MIDRRLFIRSGVALASALAIWPRQGGAEVRASAASLDSAQPSLALVDRHLAGSADFAAAARSRGLRTLEFTRDVAGLWMRELEPRLRLGPVAFAGYTSAATLFCLDLLARDYGARTVRRADGGAAVSFVISSSAGRRAPLAPAAIRAQWGHSDA